MADIFDQIAPEKKTGDIFDQIAPEKPKVQAINTNVSIRPQAVGGSTLVPGKKADYGLPQVAPNETGVHKGVARFGVAAAEGITRGAEGVVKLLNPDTRSNVTGRGLKKVADALHWARTGEDVDNPTFAKDSPLMQTEEEKAASPVGSRVAGAIENFGPFAGQMLVTGGAAPLLGLAAGGEHLAESSNKYKVANPTATDQEAMTKALPGAITTGTLMAGMGKVAGYGKDLLAKAVPKLFPATVEGATKYGVKEAVRDTATTMLTDTPYMVGQGMATGEIDKAMGISPEYKVADSLKWDSILETALTTALFGAVHASGAKKRAAQLKEAINNPELPVPERMAAAQQVAEQLKKRGDKQGAEDFHKIAQAQIMFGQPVKYVGKDFDVLNGQKAEPQTVPEQPAAEPTLDDKAHAAATSPLNDLAEPTEAQKDAGNYKHGDEIKPGGIPILIENPQGSTRSGVSPEGEAWQTILQDHYGRIKGTEGADSIPGKKQGLDVFVKPGIDESNPPQNVYAIDQIDPKTGKYDETKFMLGYDSKEEAQAAYLRNYDQTGPTRIGAVTETNLPDFNNWRKSQDTKQAFAAEAFKNGQLKEIQDGQTNEASQEASNAIPAEGQGTDVATQGNANEGRQEELLKSAVPAISVEDAQAAKAEVVKQMLTEKDPDRQIQLEVQLDQYNKIIDGSNEYKDFQPEALNGRPGEVSGVDGQGISGEGAGRDNGVPTEFNTPFDEYVRQQEHERLFGDLNAEATPENIREALKKQSHKGNSNLRGEANQALFADPHYQELHKRNFDQSLSPVEQQAAGREKLAYADEFTKKYMEGKKESYESMTPEELRKWYEDQVSHATPEEAELDHSGYMNTMRMHVRQGGTVSPEAIADLRSRNPKLADKLDKEIARDYDKERAETVDKLLAGTAKFKETNKIARILGLKYRSTKAGATELNTFMRDVWPMLRDAKNPSDLRKALDKAKVAESDFMGALVQYGINARTGSRITRKAGFTENWEKVRQFADDIQGKLAELKQLAEGTDTATEAGKVDETHIPDVKRVQELRDSIAEGELILKTKKFNGKPQSKPKLEAVARSVESAKAKLEAELKGPQEVPAPEESTGPDYQSILDAISKQTGITKGKTSKGNFTDSDFQNYLKEVYPEVAGMDKKLVLSALKAKIAGRELTDGQRQVIDKIDEHEQQYRDVTEAEQQQAEADLAAEKEIAPDEEVGSTDFFGGEDPNLIKDRATPDDFTLTGDKEKVKAPTEKQGDLFKQAPTFGKKEQGKGVADENPMEQEIRDRKGEADQTSFADTGGYAKRPSTASRIEMPELVKIAKAINEGKLPQLVDRIASHMGRALGRFMYNKKTGDAKVQLRKDLFAGPQIAEAHAKVKDADADYVRFQNGVRQANPGADIIFRKDYIKKTGTFRFSAFERDPDYVMKTFEHEIGHNVDYLPDSMVKGRGNIFGHVAALKNYFKETLKMYPDAKGEPLEKADRERLMKEARATTPKGEDIITTVTREVPKYEEAGITPEMITSIWQDVNARDKYPDLYKVIAKMSDAEKKAVVVQAMKGMVDARLKAMGGKRQVGTETITETIVTPAKQRPEAVKAQFEKLLREEILKRRLYEKEVMMDELKKLTQIWKPFNEAQDAKYTQYRHSPEELYADAVSVLFNEPQLLKDTAPSFYKAFHFYMGERPEFRDAYRAVQQLNQDPFERAATRYEDKMAMYEEGSRKADQIRKDAAKTPEKWMDTLKYWFIDKNHEILKELPDTPEGRAVRDHLNEIQYLGGEVGNYVRKAQLVREDIEKAGLTVNDLGAYLQAKHVIESRHDKANPGGSTAATEAQQLRWMKTAFGPEAWAALQKAEVDFHKSREYIIDRIQASGIATPELMASIKGRDNYVHFEVQKYMDGKFGQGTAAGAGWKKHAEGTLEDITNPFVSTVMQDMSILRMAKINEAKKSITDVFGPKGLMTPAEMRFSKDAKGLSPVPPEKGKALLMVLNEGKPTYYVVDKHVADTFTYDPVKARAIGKVVGYISQYFRDVLVSKNPAWMLRNVYRDMKGTIKNNPEIAWWNPVDRLRLLKAYKEAFKEVKAEVRGKAVGPRKLLSFRERQKTRSEDIETMYQNHMLNTDRMFASAESTFDDELARIAHEFRFGEEQSANIAIRNLKRVYNYLDDLGKISEQTSKVAGYKFLKAKGVNGGEMQHRVRTRIGTPDYRRQGALQKFTNNIFMFSNVNKEGMRSMVEAFRADPTSYVMKTVEQNMLPKLLLGMAAAGVLGEEIKEVAEKIPSWDRRSYSVVPLPNVMTQPLRDAGLIGDDSVAYLRLPGDYEGQFFGALAYDMSKGIGEAIKGKESTDSFAAARNDLSQVNPYRLHPALQAVWDWTDYMKGVNPRDSFRQKPVLTREQEKYLEVEGPMNAKSLSGMVKHTMNSVGIGNLYRMDNKEFPKELTVTEKALKTFPLNAIGSYIMVTDAGNQERQLKAIFDERNKKAIKSFEVGDVVNDAVREGSVETRADRKALYNQLVEDGKIDKKGYTFGRFNLQIQRTEEQKKYGVKPMSKKESKILQGN